GRSVDTARRAEAEGLTAVGSLAHAVEQADVVLSICPPAAAVEVATQVAGSGFAGVYVDANAISPDTMGQVAEQFDSAQVIDGGIIGPPPGSAGTTRLYFSGATPDLSGRVSGLWQGSTLDVRVLDGPIGTASALKMTYAAWTKGSAALLATVTAAAHSLGVMDDLVDEWALSQPGLREQAERTAAGVGPKAWRFEGEMIEIANTFEQAGVPDGFWLAAAETYRRLVSLKNHSGPTITELAALLVDEPG
ncbi:MAG: DUF1932 domain-containing protein, partial [Acidimicrobiia bacterium]|nr:DUF1932 domain-containing protein [Acidimicrobiia bacterium]